MKSYVFWSTSLILNYTVLSSFFLPIFSFFYDLPISHMINNLASTLIFLFCDSLNQAKSLIVTVTMDELSTTYFSLAHPEQGRAKGKRETRWGNTESSKYIHNEFRFCYKVPLYLILVHHSKIQPMKIIEISVSAMLHNRTEMHY